MLIAAVRRRVAFLAVLGAIAAAGLAATASAERGLISFIRPQFTLH